MTRRVEIDVDLNQPRVGARVEYPVKVFWPELQLTEHQLLANAAALAAGRPDPYPDQSIFCVSIRFIPEDT